MPAIMISGQFPSSKLNIGCGGGGSCYSLFPQSTAFSPRISSESPVLPSFPAPTVQASSAGHEFESVFRYFDEDGDGKISAAELCTYLRSVGGSCYSLFPKIHSFFSQNKLRKPGLASSPAPARQESSAGHELECVFRYFDEDGDGKISVAQLCNRLRSVGDELSPAEAEAVVESSDSDGDGMLGYEDFVKLVGIEEKEERERILMEAFSAYLMEGVGGITARSLQRALRLLGEGKSLEECRDMIKRFDLNGDGVISFEEFKLMML